jgi:hypothetical protein
MKKLVKVMNKNMAYDITEEVSKEVKEVKVTMPTKVSQLLNDAGYITESEDDDEPISSTEITTILNLMLN